MKGGKDEQEQESSKSLETDKQNPQSEIDYQQQNVFEDDLDAEFWIKVHQKQTEGLSWNRAIDEVHVARLIKTYKDSGELNSEDPALLMLKQWPASRHYKNCPDTLPSLAQMINRLLEILLESELNSDSRYKMFRDEEDKTKRTLLHYAAELGFLQVTQTLVKKCPLLLAVKTKGQLEPVKKRAALPVELAIEAEKDEVAAYLIRMMWHDRVQSLFSWRPDHKMTNPKPSFFSFQSIIENSKMKRQSYFTEWMTLFDWLGLLLILCIIPLRCTGSKAQWLVASLAFLFNFLRIFKFSCVTRTTGLYAHTLAKIILHDVTRSMAVFIVIFFSFCGTLTLSLCCSIENQQFSDLGNVLLSGLSALSEQRPIAKEYSEFNWLSILLMMSYMGTVTVILLNILVAQMSTTYTQARKVARLEYDVDRILQLTRMERFPFLNLRVRFYKEGDWISEMKLAQELFEFSEDRSPWESMEKKLTAIRDMMRKMVKQKRPGIG